MEYDMDYYENLLRRYSATAEHINEIRWTFVLDKVRPKNILDYGSGVGWFRTFRPKHINVDSYDIGPFIQTGITREHYDIICLWDVLEHMEKPGQLINELSKKTNCFALSLPVWSEDLGDKEIKNWKHYKPGEHLSYFTCESLISLFKSFGFNLIKVGCPECPPREDVGSFLFKKEE